MYADFDSFDAEGKSEAEAECIPSFTGSVLDARN
jgi:hypothetical protein